MLLDKKEKHPLQFESEQNQTGTFGFSAKVRILKVHPFAYLTTKSPNLNGGCKVT